GRRPAVLKAYDREDETWAPLRKRRGPFFEVTICDLKIIPRFGRQLYRYTDKIKALVPSPRLKRRVSCSVWLPEPLFVLPNENEPENSCCPATEMREVNQYSSPTPACSPREVEPDSDL